MKKMLLILVVLVAGATSTYALNRVECGVFYSVNSQRTFDRLMTYLDVDNEQADNLRYVLNLTESKMKAAEASGSSEAVDKAVKFNLANAKSILTYPQYIKYLYMLNMTMTNRNQETSYLSAR